MEVFCTGWDVSNFDLFFVSAADNAFVHRLAPPPKKVEVSPSTKLSLHCIDETAYVVTKLTPAQSNDSPISPPFF